jgi:hypothetical protein
LLSDTVPGFGLGAPRRMPDHGQDVGLGAVEQVDGKEVQARIASA